MVMKKPYKVRAPTAETLYINEKKGRQAQGTDKRSALRAEQRRLSAEFKDLPDNEKQEWVDLSAELQAEVRFGAHRDIVFHGADTSIPLDAGYDLLVRPLRADEIGAADLTTARSTDPTSGT